MFDVFAGFPEQFRFNYIGLGITHVTNVWFGHASVPVLKDDFGNGVEVTDAHLHQWHTTLAN